MFDISVHGISINNSKHTQQQQMYVYSSASERHRHIFMHFYIKTLTMLKYMYIYSKLCWKNDNDCPQQEQHGMSFLT